MAVPRFVSREKKENRRLIRRDLIFATSILIPDAAFATAVYSSVVTALCYR